MTANANRFSTYTAASVDSKDGEKKKDMWNSMLESVASGKRLPEKNLLVLGGTVESQRDFLEALSNNELRRTFDRQGSKIPPVANHFALGYTYYDVLDADQEDILARISFYSLTKPSPSFSSLVKPLLTPQSIPHTLVVILLDWSQPWLWMRQLRGWIHLLRTVLVSLSMEAKDAMVEVMNGWKDRGRGGGTNLDGTGAPLAGEGDVTLPLGPGEWDEGLGLPLAVVCQNADKMEFLEKMQGWKEEEFDVVLQYMRAVLLKHGASLVYTTPSVPSQLPSLIHSSLGITSLLKRQPLKHNVIDRDKIMVPPNWDSWGKIRVLRDGFDPEAVGDGWSIDLNQPSAPPASNVAMTAPATATNGDASGAGAEAATVEAEDEIPGSAVTMYEKTIEDPSSAALQMAGRDSHSTQMEVETVDAQSFLAQQLKKLEAYRAKAEQEGKAETKHGIQKPKDDAEGQFVNPVSDHIGPVQFNMGGIQVDADDIVQRLKDRQAYGSSPEPTSPDAGAAEEEPTAGMDTDNLQAFFTGLMQRRPTKAAGT